MVLKNPPANTGDVRDMGLINETKSRFFEKINKTHKPFTRLIKIKRERAQTRKMKNEKGEVTTNTTEIQKIIRDYCK